jgi:hypothetical protein
MPTLIINQATTATVTLQADGNPVAIPTGATVTAQLFNLGTYTPVFTPAITCHSTDTGSAWASGIVAVALSSGNTAGLTAPSTMLVITVNGLPYRFLFDVEAANSPPLQSALFIKDFVVSEIRADRLYAIAQTLMPGFVPTDDYIWGKVLAAESETAHTLRVRLQPTAFFPTTPTDAQITALNSMPWDIDPAYDYDPAMFQGENWSFIAVRNKPIISVTSLNYNYPSENNFQYNIPLEWLKMDLKYGQIRLVPTSNISLAMLGGFLIQLIGAGRVIPHIMNLTYVAGLTNAAATYPELVDVVLKTAVLKIIQDAFIPQSGSISADGLSQSMSIDMDKYSDMIDRMLNGPPGSNGGLMALIHGVRLMVM